MPTEVRRAVGYVLFAPSRERSTTTARYAAVLEVIAKHDGDTFRAVYTVRFGEVVYVLHVFG